MKKYTPLDGLRWSRNSDSALNNMPQTDVLGRAGGAPIHKQAIKKGRQSFQTDALLPKTAATYSPTVTQYHRRDEA